MEELRTDELRQDLTEQVSEYLIDARCEALREEIKYEACKLLEDRCVELYRACLTSALAYERLEKDYKAALDLAKQWQDEFDRLNQENSTLASLYEEAARRADAYQRSYEQLELERTPFSNDPYLHEDDDFPAEELL